MPVYLWGLLCRAGWLGDLCCYRLASCISDLPPTCQLLYDLFRKVEMPLTTSLCVRLLLVLISSPNKVDGHRIRIFSFKLSLFAVAQLFAWLWRRQFDNLLYFVMFCSAELVTDILRDKWWWNKMMAHLIFNYLYVFHLFTLATCPAQIDADCSLNKLRCF